MVIDNYFSKIFDLMPSPTLIMLPDVPRFTIVDVNNAYLKLANLAREDFIGKGFFEAFPDNQYSKMVEQENSLKEAVTYKKPSNTPTQVYEYPSINASGNVVKYFNALNTPVLNDENEVELIIRTVTDVSESIITLQKEELAKINFDDVDSIAFIQSIRVGIIIFADLDL